MLDLKLKCHGAPLVTQMRCHGVPLSGNVMVLI